MRGRAGQAAERVGTRIEPLKQQATRATTQGVGLAKEVAAAMKVPERVESARNLRRIGAALRAYHDAHDCFPRAAHTSPDGRPLLSWRVLILPHLGPDEAALFKEFNLDEPWNGQHNRLLLSRMPKVYAPPGSSAKVAALEAEMMRDRDRPAESLTFYKVFTGPGTVFDPGRRVSLNDVRDAPRFTFLVVEAGVPSPWSAPEDLPYQPDKPAPRLGFLDHSFFLTVDCDGGVMFYNSPPTLPDKALWAYVTIAAGDGVDSSGGSGGFDFD